jgi:hypothetical protein
MARPPVRIAEVLVMPVLHPSLDEDSGSYGVGFSALAPRAEVNLAVSCKEPANNNVQISA